VDEEYRAMFRRTLIGKWHPFYHPVGDIERLSSGVLARKSGAIMLIEGL
jgi:hypothetical protein